MVRGVVPDRDKRYRKGRMHKMAKIASAGGAGAAGGFDFQHCVAAWMAVHILAEPRIPSRIES